MFKHARQSKGTADRSPSQPHLLSKIRPTMAVVVSMAFLSACGAPGIASSSPAAVSTSTAAPSVAAQASTAPTAVPLTGTIHVDAPSGQQTEQFTADAKAFMASHPGTTVGVTLGGDTANGTYAQQMPDLLKSGDIDVAWFQHANTFADLQKAGLLEPLDDIWSDPALGLQTAFPAAYKTNWTDPDGHLHGVPTDIVTLPVIYYNKDQFATAGVQPPANGVYYTSNDELYAAVDKLKAAGFGGMTLTGNAPYWFDHQMNALALYSLGVDNFVALMNNYKPGVTPAITWDDPRVQKVFAVQDEYLKHGIYVGGLLARNYDQSLALFANGKASMLSDGSWTADALDKANPKLKYGWMLYPQQTPDVKPIFSATSTDGLVMSADSKNKDLAKAFISYVVSSERQDALAASGLMIPARNDISANAAKGQPAAVADMLTKFASTGVGPYWADFEALPVTDAIDNQLSLLAAGKATPEQVAKAAEAAATKVRNGK